MRFCPFPEKDLPSDLAICAFSPLLLGGPFEDEELEGLLKVVEIAIERSATREDYLNTMDRLFIHRHLSLVGGNQLEAGRNMGVLRRFWDRQDGVVGAPSDYASKKNYDMREGK